MDNLYDELGVGKKATKEQIRRAYKTKAKKVHPDRGGSSEAFSKLSEAYTILTDDNLRRTYDRTGKVDTRPEEELIKQSAINGLNNLMNGILDENNDKVIYYDLIHLMKVHCKKRIAQAMGEIKKLNKRKTLPKAVMKRIKYKGGGNDVLCLAIEHRLKAINSSIEGLEFEKKVGVKMVEMLTDYSFIREHREPACTSTGTSTVIIDGNVQIIWGRGSNI